MAKQMLAAYACDPTHSRGRLVDEGHSAHRSAFQRDRDRIVYSRAFRRLRQKAQTGILPAYEEGQSVLVRYPAGKPGRGVLVSGVELFKWSTLAAFGIASLVGAILLRLL